MCDDTDPYRGFVVIPDDVLMAARTRAITASPPPARRPSVPPSSDQVPPPSWWEALLNRGLRWARWCVFDNGFSVQYRATCWTCGTYTDIQMYELSWLVNASEAACMLREMGCYCVKGP